MRRARIAPFYGSQVKPMLGNKMTYSTAELETIGLCICLEAVDSIANHALLTLRFRDTSPYPEEAEAIFETHIHRDLFLVRLLDFVTEKGSKDLTDVDGSCLSVLKAACLTKCFDINGSVGELSSSVDALESWLNCKKAITIWLPTLDINTEITITRQEFLHISGNHSKHNLSRLTAVSKKVASILKDCGHDVPIEFIPLALDDFKTHLAENYFVYYSTWLSELLNNIRWGLQEYLNPTFTQSYKAGLEDPVFYSYEYPFNIQGEIPRQWFWRLMNNIRRKPNLEKFVGANSFKQESSLEWKQ
jgi:hypothetical protein